MKNIYRVIPLLIIVLLISVSMVNAQEETELDRALAGEFEGSEVSVFSVWVDNEAAFFETVLTAFTEETGIEVVHEGSADFETLITVRIEGGNAPDLAIWPQPGLMATFVPDGDVVAIESFMDMDQLHENYAQGWFDLATVDGELYGIFIRASTKSLVWYPVQEFEAAGYEVPETWDEMIALSDQIVADGGIPWCISIEHSGGTGWVATDWVEEIMLRTAGADVYDQWVNHEIPFNDDSVKHAMDVMAEIWFNPDYVYGGTTNILTEFIGDNPAHMFEEGGPVCWMHRQAGWITDFFGEGVEPDQYAFFYFPPIDEEHGRPVLGAGDLISVLNDTPEARALMQYLALPESVIPWIEAGPYNSPNKGVDLDWYTNDSDRAQAEILVNATTMRFDGSDLMPGSVGTGTFWTGMIDWVGGEST